jgi:glutamate-1-semialdehyde 2,1-aminomutase
VSAPHPPSVDYALRAQRVFPGGSLGDNTLPNGERMIARSGRGSLLRDVDGREYLDLVCGSGALILGHAHPGVADAVAAQAARGSHFYSVSDRAIELAERLVEAAPCAELLRFTSSGSEATFYALRLARAFTGRDKILKFEGSYVGHHDYGMFGVKPAAAATGGPPRPDTAGIPAVVRDTVILATYNDTAGARALVEMHRDELAAVIVEPVQRSIPPAPGFLAALREVTAACGVLLVFDEVVTGFRLGYGGGQQLFGVTPDLAAYGKAIANGYPLGAVAGRREVMEQADPARAGTPGYVYVSGTLGGNPVSCAAALATLEELRRPGAYARLNGLGERFRSGLADALREAGTAGCVAGAGSMFQVFFGVERVCDYRSQLAADRGAFLRFWSAMYAQGIFMSSRAKNYLSLAHGDAEADRFLDAARGVLRKGV